MAAFLGLLVLSALVPVGCFGFFGFWVLGPAVGLGVVDCSSLRGEKRQGTADDELKAFKEPQEDKL